ncbi:MAG: lytic transglycosylase domain-containing protein, partial [Chitinophagaceae bacterium]|nr:lytic transglycosylase domain-containing protein [Rubrivivax sp.]
SLHEGLRFYVGAALLETDNGYAGKVLVEQGHLRAVADGRSVPLNASNQPPAVPKAVEVRASDAEPSPPAATDQLAMLRLHR